MTFVNVFRFKILAAALLASLSTPSNAADLVMVDQDGCSYCIEWKSVIGPIYPKTEAGKFAPLTVVDIADPSPFEGGYATPVVFTPTFVLFEEGQEIGRIAGYPGEDFFWGILERMLGDLTDFNAS